MVWRDENRTDYEFMVGMFGFNFSLDKINLIKQQISINRWNEFFNPLYQYHNRYSYLSMDDFIQSDYIKFSKGSSMLYQIQNSVRNNNFTEEKLPITDISEKYYRKFILLAKENNIPILVILIPYSFSDDDNKKFNTAKDIAYEYNVPFIDFNLNYDDYNLDFSEDFADHNHLNYKGAAKFTKYLGKYLKENYDLPDRRGDPKYYSWEMNAKYEYKNVYNFELKQYTNLNEYIEKVKNADNYVIGISMLGNYQNNDAVVQRIAANFNINNIYLQNASYVIDNNKLIYSSSGSNNYLFHKDIGNYTDLVVQNGQKLSINRVNYIRTQNGINMVIYDKFTEQIVDNIYLEYIDNAINPTIKR
ncbi:SGNH/GDSL hydrolase family protein [Brachyspira hampsonii]|uniref:SGNH/GDSL hydrolase family protein n=1 Tax=Brachyspira hampsonii TaxID=1287055 RepID=UPI000AB83349|nr:SGNH/GDSL hydrolase family protein [Brachyspira hampsonii]